MSPLVKRTVTLQSGPVQGRKQVEHVAYVPPAEVRRGDEVVEPTPKQLADLRARYPEEFADRGEDGAPPAARDPEDALEPEAFARLNVRDAIPLIEAERDADVLIGWLGAEIERVDDQGMIDRRKTILEAFQARELLTAEEVAALLEEEQKARKAAAEAAAAAGGE